MYEEAKNLFNIKKGRAKHKFISKPPVLRKTYIKKKIYNSLKIY